MQATLRRGQHLVEQGRYTEIGPLFVEAFAMHLPEGMQQGIVRQFEGITKDTAMQLYAQSFEILEGADIRRYVDLTRIAADTLIVNGELDTIIDVSDTESIAREIPRCRVRIEPGVGHFLQFEKPSILDVYARFFLDSRTTRRLRREVAPPVSDLPEQPAATPPQRDDAVAHGMLDRGGRGERRRQRDLQLAQQLEAPIEDGTGGVQDGLLVLQ